jgi:hypothetical protein
MLDNVFDWSFVDHGYLAHFKLLCGGIGEAVAIARFSPIEAELC